MSRFVTTQRTRDSLLLPLQFHMGPIMLKKDFAAFLLPVAVIGVLAVIGLAVARVLGF